MPVYSLSKNRTRTITTAVAAYKNSRTGSALIELMLAIAILIIALLGTSSTYVSGRKQIVNQRFYQAAAQLASQKLEDAKSLGYAGLTESEEDETIPLYGINYQRHTVTELTAEPTSEIPKPCMKVTVTIQWTGTAGDNHQTEFVTYVGP
jgi:type II secretory pathway pseudopilin PulG